MIVIMECRIPASDKACDACGAHRQAANPGRMDHNRVRPAGIAAAGCNVRKEKMQPVVTETRVYFGCQLCGAVYRAVQIKATSGILGAHICELCSTEVVADSPDFQIRNWTRVTPLQSFSASAPQASNRMR
jgi:hypothetical protein